MAHPNPAFGNGTGMVTFTEWIEQVLPLQSDGFLLLIRDAKDARRFLQRLDSNGTPEPGRVLDPLVNSSEDRVSLIVAPDGSIWVLVGGTELNGWVDSPSPTLRRLFPDGRSDTDFGQRTGVSHFFGFDASGRAYFGLNSPEIFGDPSQGALIRFLPDGAYDASYRPAADLPGESLSCQVLPNGSTVLTQGGNVISEFGPDGRLENHTDLTDKLDQIVQPLRLTYNLLQVASAIRQTDGTLVIDAEACLDSQGDFGWYRSCYGLRYSVASDGELRPFFLPDNLSIRTGGGSTMWMSWGAGNENLWRFLAPSASPQVGLPVTGLICRESSVRIPVQRTGSTADKAEVRGRILPWDGKRWDEAFAIPFAGQFAEGSADVSIDVSLPDRTATPSVCDYLVRLEGSPGLQVSSFNECRIWVLDERLIPQPGGLNLLSPTGPNPPEISWLLAYPTPGGSAHLQSSFSLQEGGWFDWGFQDAIELGPVRVQPISNESSSAQFYRITH